MKNLRIYRNRNVFTGHKRPNNNEPNQGPGYNAEDSSANKLQAWRHSVAHLNPVQVGHGDRHRRLPRDRQEEQQRLR